MGKLGGRRAQLFERYRPDRPVRPRDGTLTGRLSVQQCFARLARDLVRILDERTGDGYVFRTDLRLRPDPRSTPLALSVAAALGLLRKHRAELGARRPDQGAPGRRRHAAGAALPAELQPFLWRKHLDFAAIAGHPFDQAPDQRASRRRPHRHRRARRQARARRHPRDRILRPDRAADLGRPAAAIARRRDLRRRCARSPLPVASTAVAED